MLITKGLASRIFTALVWTFDADEEGRAMFLEPRNLLALNDNKGYPLNISPGWAGPQLRLDHVYTATGITLKVGKLIVAKHIRDRVREVNEAIGRAVKEGQELLLLDPATANLIYDQMVERFGVEEERRLEFVDQVTNLPTHEYTPPMTPFGCNFYNEPIQRRRPLRFSGHHESSTPTDLAKVLAVNNWLDRLNEQRQASERQLMEQLKVIA